MAMSLSKNIETPTTSGEVSGMTILELPFDIFANILEKYFTYDEISGLRLVCQGFNTVCGEMLNQGFKQAEALHSKCYKKIKGQLPRRESERRNHTLARHCDIMSAVETRLSLLSMTFSKYIDLDLCCFIPGKVLDEVFRILDYTEKHVVVGSVGELLQELRDISSMAMEYFEEKIAPKLQSKYQRKIKIMAQLSPASSRISLSSRAILHRVQTPVEQEVSRLTTSLKELSDAYKKDIDQIKIKLNVKDREVKELQKLCREQKTQISEHEERINDLTRKLVEASNSDNNDSSSEAESKVTNSSTSVKCSVSKPIALPSRTAERCSTIKPIALSFSRGLVAVSEDPEEPVVSKTRPKRPQEVVASKRRKTHSAVNLLSSGAGDGPSPVKVIRLRSRRVTCSNARMKM